MKTSARVSIVALFAAVVMTWLSSAPLDASIYTRTDLVSNGTAPGTITDNNLVNPWGIVPSPTGPWWVANNGSNTSTLYNGAGAPQALVVSTAETPTGIVFNPNADLLLGNGQKAVFLFADQGGGIQGWNGAAGTTAINAVSSVDASYTGLALATVGGASQLYAADFANGKVDAYDGAFAPLSLSFTDPNLPTDYAPFGIQNVGGQIYVAYALRGSDGDEVHAPGDGLVDVFDTSGGFVRRLATGGALNAPWGIALAPGGFGDNSGKLLVGNFGDGHINVFEPSTGAFLGALEDAGGPIVIDGLWGIGFGNGGTAGPANVLYFAAGINDETDGLFGSISIPEPATGVLLGLAVLTILPRRRSRMRTQRPTIEDV